MPVEGPEGWGGIEGDGEDAGAGATVVRLTVREPPGAWVRREASGGGVDGDLHGHGAAPDLGDGGADGSTCLLDDVLGEGRSDDEDERAVDVDEVGHADHGHLALPQLSGAGEHLKG